ncbi:MerR family transcriptional regulator [Micrococcales bacterium 31B]|nr:MerR family transcriptional regulator [Micrococcales bacterium 31B]
MHPQTLRSYDRQGLVSPRRTSGRGRRYSAWDIAQLRQVQHLSQVEGINLAGIKRILALENQLEATRQQLQQLALEYERLLGERGASRRVFSTGPTGVTVQVPRGRASQATGGELVVYGQPLRGSAAR